MRLFSAVLMGLSLAFAPAAFAHEEPEPGAGIAQVIVNALAPSSYDDWGYDWGPVSARVSRHMHWHLFEPDPRDRPADYVAQRNGWIDAVGVSIGVSAYGGERRVTELSFRLNEPHDIDVRAALTEAGVVVETLREAEDLAQYRITAPERHPAWLTRVDQCTSPRSRAAQRCWSIYTLRFASPN
jgi:hypothetical protein